jgi:hypothetical protein
MTIHWNRIIAFLLLVAGGIIALTTWRSIGAALRTLWAIGARHHPDEQVQGIIVLGLLGAVLVGIVRILVTKNHRGQGP